MLRKIILNDSFDDGRASVSNTDMSSKGIYFPLYFVTNSPEALIVESTRSDADFITTSHRSSIGDTECVNLQVDGLISPRLCSESCHSSYLGCDFDGSIGEYTDARRATFTYLLTYGHCFYSSLKNIAYVPPQSDFGWHTSKQTPYSGYTFDSQSIVRFEFVPFGQHYALIKTVYSISTYLPKYPNLSMATCKVSLQYAQFGPSGPSFASRGPQQVMSGSGSSAAFNAILALASSRTSDPTEWAKEILATVSPLDALIPSSDFTRTAQYDHRAYLPINQAAAEARLSRAGIICATDSLNQKIPYSVWADLADTAIDDCHYTDTNSIAYLRDFRQTFGEVKDAAQLIRNPLNLKSWANLWLGFRFGTRLAAADTKALIDGTQKAIRQEQAYWKKKFQYVRSRSTQALCPSLPGATATRTLNYKVYYKPKLDVGSKVLKLVTDMGLFPTTKNVWDLIPFSFVVDWFVDVSDVLETIDRRAYEQYLTILSSTYSYKDEYNMPVDLSDLGFENTTCDVHFYVRQHRPWIHQSYLRLTTGHLSHVNVIDGISLLIQKKSK